jgi:hypothetical protein
MITQETLIDDPMQVAEHKDSKLPPEPPTPAIQGASMGIVYPIGYSAPGAQERIDKLLKDPKVLLIDTRIKPYSWNERWKKEELKRTYGEKYHWAGKFLGNKALGTGNIEIADPEKGIAGLLKYLSEGHDLILLCQCPHYEKCHTSVIVDLLLQKANVEVVKFEAPDALGPCCKCGEPAFLKSPSGKYIYCRRCGVCARPKCTKTIEQFIMHPRMGIWVCPCIA